MTDDREEVIEGVGDPARERTLAEVPAEDPDEAAAQEEAAEDREESADERSP